MTYTEGTFKEKYQRACLYFNIPTSVFTCCITKDFNISTGIRSLFRSIKYK